MSARFDRDKAREILHVVEYNRGDFEWALDRLEECVQPDESWPQTRSTWVRRAETAETKLERLAKLREQVDENGQGWIDADEFSAALLGNGGAA
jgi:hypothetical protein